MTKCLTNELDIPISFKHLQRITKDLGVRCKRPKLELLHGSLSFVDEPSLVTCTLCGKAIMGKPILDSEFSFDSQTCLETYKKLVGVYGSNISEIGLPSEVVNVNFFFIDIVSLSDASLSVKKQIERIVSLNKMIGSCETYVKTPKDKIIVPTGDGMAIGFLFNPQSPFQLSVELHRKLIVASLMGT